MGDFPFIWIISAQRQPTSQPGKKQLLSLRLNPRPHIFFKICFPFLLYSNSLAFILHVSAFVTFTFQCLNCDTIFSVRSFKAATKRVFISACPVSPIQSCTDERSAEKRRSYSYLRFSCSTSPQSPVSNEGSHTYYRHSHLFPPIAVFMLAAYEAMLLSLAKEHLFNRAGYTAACSF